MVCSHPASHHQPRSCAEPIFKFLGSLTFSGRHFCVVIDRLLLFYKLHSVLCIHDLVISIDFGHAVTTKVLWVFCSPVLFVSFIDCYYPMLISGMRSIDPA